MMHSSASCSSRFQSQMISSCLGPVLWLQPPHRPPHLASTNNLRSQQALHGRRTVSCASSQLGLRARWCIDVRYGCKSDATLLLQEWVRDVGSKAGLSAANTKLSSGSIGVPESRLELEVSFPTLSDWEIFLNSIPFKEHKAWSQRIASMIVNDDSPKWEVFRVIPLAEAGPDTSSPAALAVTTSDAGSKIGRQSLGGATAAGLIASSLQLPPATITAQAYSPLDAPPLSPLVSDSGNGGVLTLVEDSTAASVILDWKGDPMVINPKDKLPFKFL